MPRAFPPALALLALLAAAPAQAQTTERFFDAQGRLAGSARTDGGTTRYHDAQGRLSGVSRPSQNGRPFRPATPPRPATPRGWP